jgi:hypothetical protein
MASDHGSEAETCGIHLGIEGRDVKQANFPLPDPKTAGDFIAGRLLRDAARLSLRSGAGVYVAEAQRVHSPATFLGPLLR